MTATVFSEDEYNFGELATRLDLDYAWLSDRGYVAKVLRYGISDVLEITTRKDGVVMDDIRTLARLIRTYDDKGKRAIGVIARAPELQLDVYRGKDVPLAKRERLLAGETVCLEDITGRAYIVRLDRALNRLLGRKKARIIVPTRLGDDQIGWTDLTLAQCGALKDGQPIAVTIAGQPYCAQIDAIDGVLSCWLIGNRVGNTYDDYVATSQTGCCLHSRSR